MKHNKSYKYISLAVLILFIFGFREKTRATTPELGLELRTGISKLEGDWQKPRLNWIGAFLVHYSPVEYFTVVGELGYSHLSSHADAPRIHPILNESGKYRTVTMPAGLNFRFNFFPFKRWNPYSILGSGVIGWEAQYGGKTISQNNALQKGIATYTKAAGGVEYRINNKFAANFEVDFKYTSLDELDQLITGNERDGIISIYSGLIYYFRTNESKVSDYEGIPYALQHAITETKNRNPFERKGGIIEQSFNQQADSSSAPLVIHDPVRRVEEKTDIKIIARIVSSTPLKVNALLYRNNQQQKWSIRKLVEKEDHFETVIKAEEVSYPVLEYCVVALNQNMKGLGYAGLPQNPIRVDIVRQSQGWRIISSFIALVGWSAAAFIILKKQTL